MLDDRGKEVKILDQTAFEPWPLKGDDRIAKLIMRLAVAVRGENQLTRILIVAGMTFAYPFAAGFTIALTRSLWPGKPGWIPLLAVIAVVLVFARLQFRFLRGWKSSRLAQVVLEEGLCPRCGYNLHGIPTPEDAMIACPECGSAWRAIRIKRTAEFAPGSTFGNPLRTIHKQSSRQNWTIRDANGRRVELTHPRLRSLIRAAPAERAAELRAARREIARRSRWMRWPVLAIMWGTTAGLAFLVAYASGDWLAPFFVVLILGGASVGAVLGNFLYSARATRDILIRIRLCPSCAADMTAIEPNAEGHLGCPSCLAEWRVPTEVRS